MGLVRKLERQLFLQKLKNTHHRIHHKVAEIVLFRRTYYASYELCKGTHDMRDNYFDGGHMREKTAWKQVSARQIYLCYYSHVLKSNLETLFSLMLWTLRYQCFSIRVSDKKGMSICGFESCAHRTLTRWLAPSQVPTKKTGAKKGLREDRGIVKGLYPQPY